MRPRVIRGPLAFLAYALVILLVWLLFCFFIFWPILNLFDVPITQVYAITILVYIFLMVVIVFTAVKGRWEDGALERLPVKEVIEGVAKICPHCGTLASRDSVKCPKCGNLLEPKTKQTESSSGPE